MASSTNINGFNIGGNNNSFDQRGHFYRAFLSGNVSGMIVKQNSTPNMTVLVEHGSALLNKNTTSASVAEIKSDVSVAIDTANTANPRIDSVVIYEDTSVAIPTVEANYWQDGAGGRFKIVSLPGTAAASPVALTDANIQSAIGAGKPFARLADITVPTNSTTILNSNIDNSVRNKLGVPLGNINGGTTAGILTTDTSGVVTSVKQTLYAAMQGSDTTIPSNGTFMNVDANFSFTTAAPNTQVEILVMAPHIQAQASGNITARLYDVTAGSTLIAANSSTVNNGAGAFFPGGVNLRYIMTIPTAGTKTIAFQQNAGGYINAIWGAGRSYTVKVLA